MKIASMPGAPGPRSRSRPEIDSQWLARAEQSLAQCLCERDLVSTSCRLILNKLRPRQIALALVQPHAERLVRVAYVGALQDTVGEDQGQSFEPGSPLRAFLYGRVLGPGNRGWFTGEAIGSDPAWPFASPCPDRIWLCLRAGPEVMGCLVIEPRGGAAALCSDECGRQGLDMAQLTSFGTLLALQLQVLRLRTERDERVEELDASLRQLIVEQAWLRSASAVIAGCRSVRDVVDAAYRSVRYELGFDHVYIHLVQASHGLTGLCMVAGATVTGEMAGEDDAGFLALDDPELARLAPGAAHLVAGAPYWYCTDAGPATHPAAQRCLDKPLREQITVGIRRSEHLLGMISVDNAITDRPLPEARAEVLVTFAQLVATALENARLTEAEARLYEMERDRAQRLQEADTMRREFLATVSHELRTPLTGVIGFAETLTGFWDQLSDERRLSSLEKLLTSAQRLDRLVRDLLLASRVEDPHFAVRTGTLDAVLTAMHAADEIQAKYPGQRVVVNTPSESVAVCADGERLSQILVNLLDNAVKYSPEGRDVSLDLCAEDGRATFRIRDEGPGISPSQMERLFERFSKLGHKPRAGLGGTGLGLYICRHLVRAMGGEIAVQSKTGEGSTFSFSLALATRPERAGT